MAKRGRPMTITPEQWDEIFETIAETDMGLERICQKIGVAYRTVVQNLDKNEELSQRYTRAKEKQLDYMAETLTEIADDARNDWMEVHGKTGDSKTVLDREHIQRTQLRISTRQWLLERLRPVKYGNKQTVEHSGQLEVRRIVELPGKVPEGSPL